MVKGAGFRSQCVVLRRFESYLLHQQSIVSGADHQSPLFSVDAMMKYGWSFDRNPSRGSRAVKGAAFRSLCVVLRRFESCPLHHPSMSSDAGQDWNLSAN